MRAREGQRASMLLEGSLTPADNIRRIGARRAPVPVTRASGLRFGERATNIREVFLLVSFAGIFSIAGGYSLV